MSLSSLFQRGKSKSASKRRNLQRTQMRLEQLERREVFVVAADGFAEAVLAGTGFDGVVQLGNGCTGSLLWTGRHVLTAAHCVDFNVDRNRDGINDQGDGIVDAGTSIHLDMPGRAIMPSVPATSITMHPSWNGVRGPDLAIITLQDLAPSGLVGRTGAERYEIYRFSDEVGQLFNFVG